MAAYVVTLERSVPVLLNQPKNVVSKLLMKPFLRRTEDRLWESVQQSIQTKGEQIIQHGEVHEYSPASKNGLRRTVTIRANADGSATVTETDIYRISRRASRVFAEKEFDTVQREYDIPRDRDHVRMGSIRRYLGGIVDIMMVEEVAYTKSSDGSHFGLPVPASPDALVLTN